MDYEKLFPGRFLKSCDFDGKDVTLTIASVRAEEIDGKAKAIVRFDETKKELVMNRTNAEAVRTMFGRETNEWTGKRVTWYPATIKDPFGDGEVGAIRVRGSPDIDGPKQAEIKRGSGARTKVIRVNVIKTGQKPKANGAAKPKPPTPEEVAANEAAMSGEPGDLG